MTDWGRTGQDRIALVTGGGTGIGLAIARGLSAEGYAVVITGRRAAVLEKAAAEISAETGHAVRAMACDVGRPDDVAAAFDTLKREFGRLDVLVNNAGSNVSPALLEDIPFEEWSSILAANLTGAFLCTQHAFRIMKDQTPRGGRIINNGSISATTPRPNSAPYTATLTMQGLGTYSYSGTLALQKSDGVWKVVPDLASVHPELQPDTHLARTRAALSVLQQKSADSTVYGPDGQQDMRGSARTLVVG